MGDPVAMNRSPESGPEQALEHIRADYDGGGAANLMASLRQALAPRMGNGTLATCRWLQPEEVAACRHVVLLVVDGLGLHQLRRHAPDGFLATHCRGSMSAVFPSTTASAITTFVSAEVPAVHGLLGWHTWLPSIGVIAAPLPYRVRGSEVSLDEFGLAPEALFPHAGFFPAIDRGTRVIHPEHLVDSTYTRRHTAPARRVGYRHWEELLEQLLHACRGAAPEYVYAYWPELDACSHVNGSLGAAAAQQVRDIDAGLELLWRRLRGTGTLLLVTADHGFVDVPPRNRVQLEDHPQLQGMLRMPLCGEPRSAVCHLRPGALDELTDYVHTRLSHACEVHPSAGVLQQEWLGPAPSPHPELPARLGDAVLIMKGDHCIVDRLPAERPFDLIGVHGGLSRAELDVPLVVVETG
jgi:hypothetical protein